MAGAAGDGRLNVRLQFQVDEITFSETSLSAALVCLSLHSLRGAEQMKSDQVMHSFPPFHPRLKIRNRRCQVRIQTQMTWWKAIENLEWRSSQSGVIGGVIPILGQRQPLSPLRWTCMNEAAQECFQTLIYALGFLGVIRKTHMQIGAHQFEQEFQRVLVKILSQSDIITRGRP